MYAMKVLAFAALLCAVAVQANSSYSWHGKTLTLTSVDSKTVTWGTDSSAKLGDTGGLVFTFKESSSIKLYQSGIYVDVKSASKLLNYQATLVLSKAYGKFPAGSIFIVGDGTGVQDSVTLPKAIVGGTGPYAGVTGTYSSVNGKASLKFN